MSKAYAVTFIVRKIDDTFDQGIVEDAIFDDGFEAIASILSIPFPVSDAFEIIEVHEVDEES